MHILAASTEELRALGAELTAREIAQQPELWAETFAAYREQQERIERFLHDVTRRHGRLRVLFAGAGSSAYVGDVLLPFVKLSGDEGAFEFQATPTTSIVSNPASYLRRDLPTLLVSFARSGNSPESTAAVALARDLVQDLYQITLTCAPEGQLARQAGGDPRNLLWLMPERSNDQGFAMTGSFTCMTLAGLLIFDRRPLDEKARLVDQICAMGQEVIAREPEIGALANLGFRRIVYLGSGPLAGIAREAQLKILELTAGKIATAFDTPLGFRHGPKSFVDEHSAVFVLVANDPYTRKYDLDMLRELRADGIARAVCAVAVEHGGDEDAGAGAPQPSFRFPAAHAGVPDGYLALPYTVFGQILALHAAVRLGNRPDTPSPTGTVNRVVRGVTIHAFPVTGDG
ncbi:tagatose-6-phosphate ketose isomerase [Symbiobacterium thermophilum]|uniref:tagatose-6-phosphate ketose isomerase n=1 Tax=Symbiobacterium thermophilum TaxID=2734 RepID=UPI0035C76E26